LTAAEADGWSKVSARPSDIRPWSLRDKAHEEKGSDHSPDQHVVPSGTGPSYVTTAAPAIGPW
jgi:hypothetical protein